MPWTPPPRFNVSLANSLELMLVRDEGEVLHAYTDSEGFVTLGVGRLIDAKKGGGITQRESRYLLQNDIVRVKAEVALAFPWLSAVDSARQAVIHSMVFQLGLSGVRGFPKFLEACIAHDWGHAAAEMKDSKWFKQTPTRVERLAKQLVEGLWQ